MTERESYINKWPQNLHVYFVVSAKSFVDLGIVFGTVSMQQLSGPGWQRIYQPVAVLSKTYIIWNMLHLCEMCNLTQ